MRKIAFGYSTRCNIKCEHCVAADENSKAEKMSLDQAKSIVAELADAQVRGISFTAGEPLIYLDDLCELLRICHDHGIYTRVVTNSFWAKTAVAADNYVTRLKKNGLSQLRLSYSRWHQKNVKRENVVHAAKSCMQNGMDYFVSFVTDLSKQDDKYEVYLRQHGLRFFPEPVIFFGRAKTFERTQVRTDYQDNRCPMNPYLAPNFDMYACCDAGSHFTKTNFFYLGNARQTSLDQLFVKSENNRLYNHIRNVGISGIASFAGFKARDIIRYRKCELCEALFNSPEILKMLEDEAGSGLVAMYK